MIICPEHEFVYVRVPKTGNTSMISFLSATFSRRSVHKVKGKCHRITAPPVAKDYTMFCQVRNPFTRMIFFWLSDCWQRGVDMSFVGWMERIALSGQHNWISQSEFIDKINHGGIDVIIRFEDRIRELQAKMSIFDDVDSKWDLLRKDYSWVEKVGKYRLHEEAIEMVIEHSGEDFDRFGYSRKCSFL